MEKNRQWYYRGSLKACNYSCSYCPFSKKHSSVKMLNADKEQLFIFIERLEQLKARGAVQIVPYGEAMIHSYYWEGLARLSNIQDIEAVGAQSNFSFSVKEMITYYKERGGQIEKLRLWGTFHPEMTSVERFVKKCEELSRSKVLYSVGVVGDPARLHEIQQLRERLDASIYLWINKMDGLGRNYTSEEIQQFQEIDEYFMLEIERHMSSERECRNQIFVEADGSMKKCNLCKSEECNLYENVLKEQRLLCTRRECSCYLAYNNCINMDLFFFRPYSAFRIPIYPKAVFFDLDGTLIPKGCFHVPEKTCKQLQALAKHSDIYIATSLPLEDALKKLKNVKNVFSGGVFASGGRVTIYEKDRSELRYDEVSPMNTDWISNVETLQSKYQFHCFCYQKESKIYKVTLSFPKKRAVTMHMVEEIIAALNIHKSCRWFVEENCIEIVRADRGKLEGIFDIMEEMNYQKEEVMVVGDSAEDDAMLNYFSWSVRMS